MGIKNQVQAPKEDYQRGFSEFLKNFSTALAQGEIIQSAIVIAYYALFSIFPIIIIIGNLIPMLHISASTIEEYLTLLFPSQVEAFLLPIVKSLLTSKSNGYLSFGVLVAIWSFSCLINAIRIGMNRIYGVHGEELKQNFLQFLWVRTLTVLTTTAIILLFTLVGVVFIFGQQILGIVKPVLTNTLFLQIQKVLSFKYHVVMILLIIVIFYFNRVLPNIKIKKPAIWPGLVTTVAGWWLLSFAFSWYLRNFNIGWQNYGIIGIFIMFMFWLYMLALIMLIGTCINAAIVTMRHGDLNYSYTTIVKKEKNNIDES
ncbi:MAG: YihY/virulence factor BrkB family protein [Lactobacillus sp.]|nr:YihY/virulence factor BrkB family protein [Lactobacillus sp.]